jgi:phage terminase large subunit
VSITPEAMRQWVAKYRADPVAFIIEVLNAKPDAWQCDFLRAVARGDRRICVRSGHRVGKSTVLAWLCIWYMLTRYPFKIGVTAPTTGQLEDAFYAELRTWIQRLPNGVRGLLEVKSDRVDLVASAGTAFLTIKTSRVETPEALAGLHSDNTLLLVDEASGVPDPVFESATGSMAGSNAQMIMAGNPLRATGYFYNAFTKMREFWTCFHVSSVDCPRVGRDWIEEKKVEYGGESNQYGARVLGEFPRGDDDTIIPLELVTSAIGRDIIQANSPPEVWGLDVARKGHNASALCRRIGRVVPAPVQLFRGLDLMQLCGRVHALYTALPESQRPVEVCIDAIGMGGGPADRLKELGLPIRAINVAESPAVGATFFNLRSELWHKARAWFEARNVSIPKDDRLVSDLTKIRYDYTGGRSDRIQAESKKKMEARGIVSPDVGDAFCLTFAGLAARAQGQGSRMAWNKPIKRNLPGVV